jgi:two-component system sensor histidine kinase DesK
VAVGVVGALGAGIAVITGDPTELTFMTFAIALSLMLLPMVWSWSFGLLVAAVQIVLEQALLGVVPWGNTSTLVLVTVGLGTFYRLINTTVQLRMAREEVRHLAVADERARLARDLHDVLGHSLTTITVKSGLARRVLESGADREQAVSEVREVEELARRALAEIRSTVSGYRKASLAAELVGARQALAAAGITADLPHAVDDVAAPLREPFAYVLREAVTNVIRHSGASRCEVRLGQSWIEVRDDGTGKVSTVEDGHGGSGLNGLSERLAGVGAGLRAESMPGGGFLVRAGREGAAPDAQAVATQPRGERAVGPA